MVSLIKRLRVLDNEKDVVNFINQRKFCYCYGAGVYGQRFVKYCNKKKLNIDAFVISDDQEYDMGEKILNLPVYRLSNLGDFKNCNIIIAVDKLYHEIILNNLYHLYHSGCIDNIAIIYTAPKFLINDYEEEVKKRERVSIFDYKRLSEDMDLVTNEKCSNNAFYGHDKIVKRLLGKSERDILDASIEHGPSPAGNVVLKEEAECGNTYYVASENRANLFKKYLPNKQVESIGSYMQYVDCTLSSAELDNFKKKLGKTLLVFPYHSSHYIETQFNEHDLILEIEKIKNKFDTVLICMYWKDILLKKEQQYKDKKYKIVTAGHIFDYNFLARLKSIIKLSDVSMSNAIGTHIGYCVYLGKQHYLCLNNMTFIKNGKVIYDAKQLGVVEADRCIIKYDAEFQRNIEKQAIIHFGEYKEYLTNEAINFVKEYWGEWK